MDIERYRRIRLINFNRIPIPEFIGESLGIRLFIEKESEGFDANDVLPEKIRKIFLESDKDSVRHEGLVYQRYRGHATIERGIQEYTCSEDITEKAKSMLSSYPIEDYLSFLRQSTGKELSITNLLKQVKDSNMPLYFLDYGPAGNRSFLCKISFASDYGGGSITSSRINIPLADLKYSPVSKSRKK